MLLLLKMNVLSVTQLKIRKQKTQLTQYLIGRKFSDKTVQSDIKQWPFKVESGPAEKPLIVVKFKGEVKKF